MKKNIILISLLCCLLFPLSAQEIRNDIIEIRHSRKSARKAMFLSSLFPGAGQYYADKSNLTAYIFPVIEIGLWTGYLYFKNEGKKAESDYEKYADQYYFRNYQYAAENDLINDPMNNSNFYTDHFRLDDANTQHYYEDIGKYNKYVYGWLDWFDIYAKGEDGFSSPDWIWNETPEGNRMIGVNPMNTDSSYYLGNQAVYDAALGRYSSYRQVYIGMRRDAEKLYDKSRYFSFGILANHMISALHSVSVVRKFNRTSISTSSNMRLQLAPVLVNDRISPALFVQTRF